MEIKGIDVSSWQDTIDWNAVKSDGIEYAILRSSFGSPSPNQIDNQFYQNVRGAQAAGMPIGAYHYGYAVTEEQAREEARFFLDTIKDIQFAYPVYYDVEDSGTMGTVSREALTNIIDAFCKVVQDAGYYVGVYANLNWLENKFYPQRLPYDIWVAQYHSVNQYQGNYGMWQYTSNGVVKGIAGRVDMNTAYLDYPAIIKEKGLNGFGSGETGGSGGSGGSSGSSDALGIGSCTADILNVRSGPGTEYNVVFQLAEGNMVDVLQDNGQGWLYINCLHGRGWCAQEYISWTRLNPTQPAIGVGSCIADLLNVRSGPGTDFDVVFQLAEGNMVDVLQDNGDGWLYINCLHGVGWCAAEYINWYRTQVDTPAIGVGRCIADLLNVRSGPGTSYDVVFQLAQGNLVDVLQDNGEGWLSINCLHGRGWCAAEYISW